MNAIVLLVLLVLTGCGPVDFSIGGRMGEEARARLDQRLCPGATSYDASAIENAVQCGLTAATAGSFPVVTITKELGGCKSCGTSSAPASRRFVRASGRDEHGNEGTISVCKECGSLGDLNYEGGKGPKAGISTMYDLLNRLRDHARGTRGGVK